MNICIHTPFVCMKMLQNGFYHGAHVRIFAMKIWNLIFESSFRIVIGEFNYLGLILLQISNRHSASQSCPFFVVQKITKILETKWPDIPVLCHLFSAFSFVKNISENISNSVSFLTHSLLQEGRRPTLDLAHTRKLCASKCSRVKKLK